MTICEAIPSLRSIGNHHGKAQIGTEIETHTHEREKEKDNNMDSKRTMRSGPPHLSSVRMTKRGKVSSVEIPSKDNTKETRRLSSSNRKGPHGRTV